jgi:hypothetical protein
MAQLEEDEQTQGKRIQRNGIVVIVHHVGPVSFSDIDRSLYWQGLCSLQQLPLRISEIHYCFDDHKIRQAASLFTYYSLTGEDKKRFHVHDGEP